jgi:hypothetical protein
MTIGYGLGMFFIGMGVILVGGIIAWYILSKIK